MSFNAKIEDVIAENHNGLLSIHESWRRVRLDQVGMVKNGYAFKSKEFSADKGVPLIRIRDVLAGKTKTYYRGEIPDGYWVEKNDIIVGMDGDFNVAWWASDKGLLNQRVCRIDINEKNYSKRFFFYALPGYLSAINQKTSAITVKHLSSKTLEQTPFPLPSLAEQKQIAAKLDELLAQVDTVKTRLDAIPAILKRFRQSVLAAAVSGRLTEEWRGNNEYIKTEFGWAIPIGWELVQIEDVAEVKGGKRLPKGEQLVSDDTGYPYIRAGQLKEGSVNPSGQLYLTKAVQEKISRYIVNAGDVYITIVGACIGDAGIIPSEFDGANLTENAAKICLFKRSLLNAYLVTWLRSQYLQDIVQLEIKSGAQGKLALKRIKVMPVPMTSMEEQTEIVHRVEQLFAFADQIEQRVRDAQTRVNQLTQSILAKAFRGELTAEWREQNPDLISGENSAQALLEQIRAEQAERKLRQRGRRKSTI